MLFSSKNKKGRQDLKLYNPKETYLLTTHIISDYNDESGAGPISVTQYFLATKKEGKFYELFSKVEIKYEDNSISDFIFKSFNEPIIKKAEKLEKYVKDPDTNLTAEELFHFITMKNANKIIWKDSKEDA